MYYEDQPTIGAGPPAHRGPQAPLIAAPPLARELDARVTVAGKAWGLCGQLRVITQTYWLSLDNFSRINYL